MKWLRLVTDIFEESRRTAIAFRRLLWSVAAAIGAGTAVAYAVANLLRAMSGAS